MSQSAVLVLQRRAVEHARLKDAHATKRHPLFHPCALGRDGLRSIVPDLVAYAAPVHKLKVRARGLLVESQRPDRARSVENAERLDSPVGDLRAGSAWTAVDSVPTNRAERTLGVIRTSELVAVEWKGEHQLRSRHTQCVLILRHTSDNPR